MDRATRKANLKKLQLPKTEGNKQQQGKTRQTTNTAVISNFFLTPGKQNLESTAIQNNVCDNSSAMYHKKINQDVQKLASTPLKSVSKSRLKRTKLDTFIFKDPKSVPSDIRKVENISNDDDFILPKKAKMAPKASSTNMQSKKLSKRKRQTTIKSAFLRNEQLFAEIAAQHCAAEQFDGNEVQLALAISKSEVESIGIKCIDDNKLNDVAELVGCNKNAESVREKLQKYGFKTAEKKDYNTFAAAFLLRTNGGRTRSKWANKFTALTLRDPEKQLKKLNQNIETLLNRQFRTKPHTEQDHVSKYKLQSSLLKNFGVHDRQTSLQNMHNVNQSNEKYFVTNLFEISEMPAGHLLKDWSAIQGRDLTPTIKQKIERSKKLINIYKELEEYFSCSNELDWTINNEKNEPRKENEPLLTTTISEENKNNEFFSGEIKANKYVPRKSATPEKDGFLNRQDMHKKEPIELSKIKNLKEDVQKNNINLHLNTSSLVETVLENKKNTPSNLCDSKILQLLPYTKSLNSMNVSGCTIKTDIIINTTQKNRSNSPDLFADSDVEINEVDEFEPEVNTSLKGNSNSSTDNIEAGVTTYEIFSSDEVKNASSSEQNESPIRETFISKLTFNSDDKIIDLSQEHLEISNHSKPIVEIDLFVQSPLQEESNFEDINSKSKLLKIIPDNKKELLKFTSNTDHPDHKHMEKKRDSSLKLSLGVECSMQLNDFKADNWEDEIVIREMAMDKTYTSFFDFQGSKQLKSCFHKETAICGKDTFKDTLTGNDTLFRELCNTFLDEATTTDSILQTGNKSYQKNVMQTLPIITTPEKCKNNTSCTMDFHMIVERCKSLLRKSTSFTVKTPLKTTNNFNVILSKSQSFNNDKSNVNIDLTQNEYNGDDDVGADEYEDCLVLSDDEINYSIWQANKTDHLQNSETSDTEDVINISDDDQSDKEEHVQNSQYVTDFSTRDFKSPSNQNVIKQHMSLTPNTMPAETSYSDVEEMISKYVTSKTPSQEEAKFDRSEFGILEDHSEPNDFIPNLCTPTKVLNEASFLDSPTETSAPMKRYSNCQRSSQKFQELLNSIATKSSPPLNINIDFNDYDEFDRLVYTSSIKTKGCFQGPKGIEKLITAEIRFKEIEKTPDPKVIDTSNKCSSGKEEIKCNNKTYNIRYTSSPKPNYTKYTEAELLKELYNFGIKPLKRNQAVKMLEYIYNQTHPIIKEDIVKKKNETMNVEDFQLPSTSKSGFDDNSGIVNTFKSVERISHAPQNTDNLTESVNHKLNLKDSCGRKMLRYSANLKAELIDENYILQTNVTKKTPQPLLPFHIAWYNLVCSNRKLHESILMYEPIDLQEIYLFFKSLGYRYDPKDLKVFFDHRSIIFRYDITGVGNNGKTKNNNRHVKRTKQKS